MPAHARLSQGHARRCSPEQNAGHRVTSVEQLVDGGGQLALPNVPPVGVALPT
jgi:hypothetical protein